MSMVSIAWSPFLMGLGEVSAATTLIRLRAANQARRVALVLRSVGAQSSLRGPRRPGRSARAQNAGVSSVAGRSRFALVRAGKYARRRCRRRC
jgi:hypothetical protein